MGEDRKDVLRRVGVSRWLGKARPRKQRQEEVKRLSFTDELTGFFNRRGIRDRLKQMIESPEDYVDRDGETLVGQDVGILMLDLDHLKKVNDAHGHPKGDEALSKFAKAVQSQVRKTDAVLRYGGEEFAVFLFGAENGEEVYKEINDRLKQLPILTGENSEEIEINFSAGLSRVDWQQMERLADVADDELISIVGEICSTADDALYRAKESGRGQLVVASE